MKVGVSTYSFHRAVRSGKMDKDGVVRAAAEIGLDGVEMLDIYWTKDFETPNLERRLPTTEEVKAYRKLVEDSGMTLACYTIHNDFGTEDAALVRRHIERVKKHIQIGSMLGVKFMRVESCYGPEGAVERKVDAAPYEKRVIEATKEVAEVALRMGIKLGLENHGRLIGSYHQLGSIIKGVNSPAYGANLDIGNFVVVDEDPLEATRALAKYATCVHIKDFQFFKGSGNPGPGWGKSNGGRHFQGTVVGEGALPVKECVKTLADAGYDGFLNIEHESPEDPVEGVKRSAENIRRMLKEIGT